MKKDIKKLAVSVILGFFIPGLGYWYIKEKLKGCVFFISIVSCYFIGYFLAEGIFWYEMNILAVLGTIVTFFNGLPYLITSIHFFSLDHSSAYYEVGKTFMLVSGALNMLTLLFLIDHLPSKEDKPVS